MNSTTQNVHNWLEVKNSLTANLILRIELVIIKVSGFILRPKILSAALTSLSLTGPQRPNHEYLYSQQICTAPHPQTHTQWESLLTWLLNPSTRLASLHMVLKPISFNFLPTHGVIQAIQLHTPAGIRGYPILLLLQGVSPTPLSAFPVWLCMVCSVLFPQAMSVTNKLLSRASVKCQVSYIQPSHTVVKESSFTNKVNRR